MLNESNNPLGTDGFEFIEFTAPDTGELAGLFEKMGFKPIFKHRTKDVVLYRQGDINFIINHEPNSFSHTFAKRHGPSICAFAIRVKDAAFAYEQAVNQGAKPFQQHIGPMELNIPAIQGIGGSLIYFVDRYGEYSIYDVDFVPIEEAAEDVNNKIYTHIDHLTHNVHRNRMDQWAGFYQELFNFHQIRYFDIHGKVTGLRSRAMVSPCGKIRIPINEPSDDKSQIQEYLNLYHGEGIQHIAMATDDIFSCVETLTANGITFLSVPDTYYEAVDQRITGHGEDLSRLQHDGILIDGDPQKGKGLLLQIFTENVIGPIFFEIIQRKDNDGFGEGNFQALFEAIERDQIARGAA